MRIVFPYIAQIHHIPHSLPIAAEIALASRDAEVHVAYVSSDQERLIHQLLARHAPDAPLRLRQLELQAIDRWRVARGWAHWKQLTLIHNLPYFKTFDAVVTPEQTSLFLRRLGLADTRMILTRHGAGDRDGGFNPRIRHFDFVTLAGGKIEERMLELGLIRPGAYESGVYAKLDWLRRKGAETERLFENERPTVLYNPHFRPSLSSWPALGHKVLEAFASNARYNLIFAPHLRLFERASAKERKRFSGYQGVSHLHVDLGSQRSIDMSYTASADVYLGDVSSQCAEFLLQPRPCLFIDAHATNWKDNPAYRSWALGPVTHSADNMAQQIGEAIDSHPQYLPKQRRYLEETFGSCLEGSSAAIGASAIMAYLGRDARSSIPQRPIV